MTSNVADDHDEDGEAMDDYDDTNEDEDDSCYEIEDGSSNTADDGDDDNDGSVNTGGEEDDEMIVLKMKNQFLMTCWDSMIGNQLVTVIMRDWQVYHTIDENLMKSENKQSC